MHCIHHPTALCPECLQDYGEDPQAWEEFGRHEAGERRWLALQTELLAEQARLAALPLIMSDCDLPL